MTGAIVALGALASLTACTASSPGSAAAETSLRATPAKEAQAATALASYDGEVQGMAADETTLYFAVAGRIVALPKVGGQPRTLYTTTHAFGSSEGISVDDSHVYFTHPHAGTLHRVPKTGGPSELLGPAFRAHETIAVDETHVYCVRSGDDGTPVPPGDVVRIAKTGGELEVLSAGEGFPHGLMLQGDDVYFLTSGFHEPTTLKRVPRRGGAVATVLIASVDRFVIVDGALFYLQYASGRRTVMRFDLDGSGRPPRPLAELDLSWRLEAHHGMLFGASFPAGGTEAGLLRIDPRDGTSQAVARWSYDGPNPPVHFPGSGWKTPATAIVADGQRVYWADREEYPNAWPIRVSIRSATYSPL
jgi:hypothetical protein